MNTEPVRNPDELPTAQRLAQHPRWEWRQGMLVGAGAFAGYRCIGHMDGLGLVFQRGMTSRIVTAHELRHLVNRPVPDLTDDGTAGIVRGMLQTWAAKVDGLVEIHAGTKQAVVVVSFEEAGAPWATRIRHMGATVGDAAGQCLLACWARDESQCP